MRPVSLTKETFYIEVFRPLKISKKQFQVCCNRFLTIVQLGLRPKLKL